MPDIHQPLRDLLAQLVPTDQLTPQLLQRVAAAASPDNSVDLDLDRKQRCGFPEVVYGEGKPPQLILQIVSRQQAAGQAALVTRMSDEAVDAVIADYPHAIHHPVAHTLRIPIANDTIPEPTWDNSGRVFVVTAGSCDRPVAEEAMETLQWMKVGCRLIQDVGVAGPQRLLKHVEKFQEADAIVCVAGMEAALPSVLGGHVSCPVIGVPVSVGYGTSFGGLTALLSMLTCCASNVTVVNIDAGFKGGFLAGIIASRVNAAQQRNVSLS